MAVSLCHQGDNIDPDRLHRCTTIEQKACGASAAVPQHSSLWAVQGSWSSVEGPSVPALGA
jgi:hypothetical protein